MKVILLADVKGLGKKGDVCNVKDGYAHNFLIKKNKAVMATDSNMRELQSQKHSQAKREAEVLAHCEALKEKIETTKIQVSVKAGENGKIFGSVTSQDISSALMKKGLEVDKKDIELKNPIKEVGEYNVIAKLHSKVQATIHVTVLGE